MIPWSPCSTGWALARGCGPCPPRPPAGPRLCMPCVSIQACGEHGGCRVPPLTDPHSQAVWRGLRMGELARFREPRGASGKRSARSLLMVVLLLEGTQVCAAQCASPGVWICGERRPQVSSLAPACASEQARGQPGPAATWCPCSDIPRPVACAALRAGPSGAGSVAAASGR